MKIMQGRSSATDASQAVQEATSSFDSAPEILVVFSSTLQEPTAVHAALAERFPGTPVCGCTTAGEQLDGEHSTGHLVVLGASETGVQWAVRQVEGISGDAASHLEGHVGELFEEASLDPDEFEEGQAVCLLFIDGLRGAEEAFTASLADALQGVPLAGGSAGDDLAFKETRVFGPRGALTDAATLVLAKSLDGAPIRILKHQHFVATPRSLVVTRAEGRTVHEFDGYPAVEGYAKALGLEIGDVNGDVTFMNPVTFACNGELYVRSIQAVNDDGSITFYCAVEEGMVLDVGGHESMTGALSSDLASGFTETPELVVGFNCILRALEATGKELHEEIGQIFHGAGFSLVGFDTYGEQLNGLHINQTLVAVGFGRAAA